MPWSTTTPMDQRARFIFDLQACCYTMTELCQRYGISRKTGYKWAQRFVEEGLVGLQDRSRAPRRCPHRTPEPVRDKLIEYRRAHPTWGPKKLVRVLARKEPGRSWPAPSTAGEILRQAGLVPRRRRRRRVQAPTHPPKVDPRAPIELWTADFKGQFRTGDHRYCYPLTIADRYSRFFLQCRALPSTAGRGTRAWFERTFQEYGLPAAILTDNGSPFGTRAIHHLSRLSVWWLRLGIRLVRIQPGHPEQNGAHERLHRALKRQTVRPPAASLRRQQDCFDAFVQEYNHERPHEAIDFQCPGSLYRASTRLYPSRLPLVEYPGHFEVQKVRHNGEIQWQGKRYFLSEALAGEPVGFEEVNDGLWSVCFTSLAGAVERPRRRLVLTSLA